MSHDDMSLMKCPDVVVVQPNTWDQRSSVVTPDEEVFYLVALLRSALDNGEETQSLEYLTDQNREILSFCDDAGIKVKQYLPHYTTREEWMDHFGDKWDQFYQRKMEFDPRRILATGQRIFNPSSASAGIVDRTVIPIPLSGAYYEELTAGSSHIQPSSLAHPPDPAMATPFLTSFQWFYNFASIEISEASFHCSGLSESRFCCVL
ncbi:hypothetical protein OIU78_021685 [Salix suchowensis]|nr:hypothetical protein OIU78_021685 [Salix suchowensis]